MSEGFGTLEALQGCRVQGGQEVIVMPLKMMRRIFQMEGFKDEDMLRIKMLTLELVTGFG